MNSRGPRKVLSNKSALNLTSVIGNIDYIVPLICTLTACTCLNIYDYKHDS